MINEQEFGKRLTECMQINGYTNAKLTEKLNVSKNAVGNYKNGQIPNATILYNISQLLGTTVEYLLTGKNSDETITEEEKQRMIKDDIPKFRVIGDANLSEEELVQAEQDLNKIIKRLRKRAKNKK